ncbi:MAG TPA: hypothetical protein VMU77_07735 [Acidimicrobiales bacterium]|nr:hypothetical protein [Acidimicrobiales bacterium]
MHEVVSIESHGLDVLASPALLGEVRLAQGFPPPALAGPDDDPVDEHAPTAMLKAAATHNA